MSDTGAPNPVFGVETVELDLPALAGALSRRLRDAGVPVTPERSADFARALALVRPMTRRRLYWTARSVFVSDQAQADGFDSVFFSVLRTLSSRSLSRALTRAWRAARFTSGSLLAV